MSVLNDFFNNLARYGISIEEKQKNLLIYYFELIRKFNSVMHLTSKSNTEQVILRNFFDSCILKVFLPRFESFVDLGSGAGFVGVVSKILFPDSKVFLVERSKKKASFLSIVIKELNLLDTFVLQDDWSNLILSADVAVSKASCGVNELIYLMPNLLRESGLFLHYTSRLDSCPAYDKFYQYYSPYSNKPQFICVYENKMDRK